MGRGPRGMGPVTAANCRIQPAQRWALGNWIPHTIGRMSPRTATARAGHGAELAVFTGGP
jgi:hypothetical protein